MPALTPARQPDASEHWYASTAGQALVTSELPRLHSALSARPGLPWLVFSVVPRPSVIDQPHGLWLWPQRGYWGGDVACGPGLPLASESVGALAVQHVECADVDAWLAECERVLVPGGSLTVFSLNPLSPYRGRWLGEGVSGREPVTWRRRLKRAGLVPEPVARGLGPRWNPRIDASLQLGAGARAAYLLAAEKRRMPLTPKRVPLLGPAVTEGASQA